MTFEARLWQWSREPIVRAQILLLLLPFLFLINVWPFNGDVAIACSSSSRPFQVVRALLSYGRIPDLSGFLFFSSFDGLHPGLSNALPSSTLVSFSLLFSAFSSCLRFLSSQAIRFSLFLLSRSRSSLSASLAFIPLSFSAAAMARSSPSLSNHGLLSTFAQKCA